MQKKENSQFKKMMGSRIMQNMIYAFFAQGVSLLLSVIMSLIGPKVLGVEGFSYWQLFIFYAGYIGFFHFGLNDGIYLRTGGMEYCDLDFPLLGMQYKFLIVIQTILAIGIFFVYNFFIDESARLFVVLFTVIYLVISNAALFLGYIFQAVNQTKIFSMSVMIDRSLVLISILILMFTGVRTFEPFVISYTFSKAISLLYCSFKGRRIIFAKACNLMKSFREMWINVSIGIKLMIANVASMLILGIGRIVIDNVWGLEAFGKFSLSLSLTYFFLLFLSQISMVLFPALRQMHEQKQKEVYGSVRDIVGILLPLAFVAYVPVKQILDIWLPQYQDSLRYLVLLLPLCSFDGKMQLLCNTYFKVLRKEKILLRYNIIAFLLSLSLSVVGGYVIHNVYFIIISMVFATAVRSIISELYLARILNVKVLGSIIRELVIVFIFMLSAWFLDGAAAFTIILFTYIIFLIMNRSKMQSLLRKVKVIIGK